jgi:transcriptional regulator with XRE-family HTH domain
MNDVQTKLHELHEKGWTQAAIADELDVHKGTVNRWRLGQTYPPMPRPVLMALDILLKRRRIPKKRRYGKHSRGRGNTMPKFRAGDRVRLRLDADVAVQPAVEPGAEGTVVDDHGQRPATVRGGRLKERLYPVQFDGFAKSDLVEESALEPI